MPFAYVVPLSTFQRLFESVTPDRHQQLTERLRQEIHADISRRQTGPDDGLPSGMIRKWFDSAVLGPDLVIYSPMDYEEVASKTGALKPSLTWMSPIPGLKKDPKTLREMINDAWRYPGDAGGGVFSQSVNAVLARGHVLVEEMD